MPRPTRLNLPDIPQHVTQRGNNRQACFFDDEDRNVYLSQLENSARRRECAIHAYVLMTNHVHLLVTPSIPDGVSKLMQDVGREYVRYINGKYRRSGTLWEGRFKSSLIDGDRYCLVCYRYIELNPVRATMVKTPCQYRWSSYHANALQAEDRLITPHQQWLSLGDDPPSCCRQYRALFKTQPAEPTVRAIRYHNKKGLPLGPMSFTQQIEKQLRIKLGTGKVGRPRKPG
jgi:putative transposase